MNQIQLAIVGVIVGTIVVIIAYHFYQENKFKKSIDKNFNQATGDALQEEKGMVFENQKNQLDEKIFSPQVRDIAIDDKPHLKQSEIQFDAKLATSQDEETKAQFDAEFAKYDQVEFLFADQISEKYQHVIDICFSKPAKIKLFPDLSQYTSKTIRYFVLDKNGWTVFERNKKYYAEGVKIVVDLVDVEGCIYPLQVTNIFNELSKFASHHDARIRQADSELEIRRIQQQLKNLSHAVLELELFVVNKDSLSYQELAKYFTSNGFIDNRGIFEFRNDNNVTVLYIADENGKRFDVGASYRIFSFNSKLHHQAEPMKAVDKIFDVAEHYVQYFESRLLTSNKMVMSERDYNTLERQVNSYINSCKRYNIELGSELIARVYP